VPSPFWEKTARLKNRRRGSEGGQQRHIASLRGAALCRKGPPQDGISGNSLSKGGKEEKKPLGTRGLVCYAQRGRNGPMRVCNAENKGRDRGGMGKKD